MSFFGVTAPVTWVFPRKMPGTGSRFFGYWANGFDLVGLTSKLSGNQQRQKKGQLPGDRQFNSNCKHAPLRVRQLHTALLDSTVFQSHTISLVISSISNQLFESSSIMSPQIASSTIPPSSSTRFPIAPSSIGCGRSARGGSPGW
jgi:hypothetical protein